MAGFVARSYGVSIRECLENIIQTFGKTCHREYRHIHPAFLMALVRLSDYLDLDIGRAPASILAGKSLRSQVSRREWWSHRAIVDCHTADDDPECLRVIIDIGAVPDVETFSIIEENTEGINKNWTLLGQLWARCTVVFLL